MRLQERSVWVDKGESEGTEYEIIKSLVSMDLTRSHNNRNINNVD